MTSPTLDCMHGRTKLGVALHHLPLTAHTVERCRALHYITIIGLRARADDVGRGMISPPLDSTHGRQRRAWHDITALGLADSVGRHQAWYIIIALGRQKRSNDVGRGMSSPLLDSTQGRTTSGMKCHHHLRSAHSVKRHRVWHAIIAFGQHKRSNNVGCGMTSPAFDCSHDLRTSGVA